MNLLEKTLMILRSASSFGLQTGSFVLGLCLWWSLASTNVWARIDALSLGGSVPSGGWLNSLYVHGTPINGLTLKAHFDTDWEASAFLGAVSFISLDKLTTIGNSSFYTLLGGSLPLALNVGGGWQMNNEGFFLRTQYVSLISSGGTILGTKAKGPFFIGWASLLVGWRF